MSYLCIGISVRTLNFALDIFKEEKGSGSVARLCVLRVISCVVCLDDRISREQAASFGQWHALIYTTVWLPTKMLLSHYVGLREREKNGSAFCRHVRPAAQIDISHKWTLDDPIAVVNNSRKRALSSLLQRKWNEFIISCRRSVKGSQRKCDFICSRAWCMIKRL